MKKYLVLALFLGLIQLTFGQTDYQLKYTAKVIATSKSYKKVAKQMKGSKMAFYYQDSLGRIDISIGKAMLSKNIYNVKTDSMVMFTDVIELGNRACVVKLSDADSISKSKEEPGKEEEPELTYTNETKLIGKYTCLKAFKESDGVKTTIWFMKDRKVGSEKVQVVKGMPEIPVMFEVANEGFKMIYTLKTFKKEITPKESKKLFDMSIPSKYLIVDYSQLIGLAG